MLNNNCLLDPPAINSTKQDLENCCDNNYCSRTDLRNYICLNKNEIKRWFNFREYIGCGYKDVDVFRNKIYLAIRKRGSNCIITKEYPLDADIDGNVSFYWSKEFNKLPAGYYEGDLYIDCNTCKTILFYKSYCDILVSSYKIEERKICDSSACDCDCDDYICCDGETSSINIDGKSKNECEPC